MEKRVIKFNLVAAICVLVLIIATIVGGVVLVKKIHDSRSDGNNIVIYG